MGAAVLIEQQYLSKGMELENEAIATLLAQKDESAFEQVFKTHFKRLHAYAFTILQDDVEAEEMVQQVFHEQVIINMVKFLFQLCDFKSE